MQQTVVTCVLEVITENDDSQDPACESSHQHRWRVRDQSAARADGDEDDETEQRDLSSRVPHNERARGARHENVASLVPACSGARVCHEQGREDSTGSADRLIRNAELVERCPLTTRRLVEENAAAAARVRSRDEEHKNQCGLLASVMPLPCEVMWVAMSC